MDFETTPYDHYSLGIKLYQIILIMSSEFLFDYQQR